MIVQLLIFLLMLALGFPFISAPIECTGLEETDCQTLQTATTALQAAGSFNNATFTAQAGGSGGTSEGNAGIVSGSGPIVLGENGLTSQANLTFTVTSAEGEESTQQYIFKDNMLYVGTPDDSGELVWAGADFNAEDAGLTRELLTGQLLTEALTSPGVVTTLRVEDTELKGQPMQVFVSNIDFITFLTAPNVLARLQEALAGLPEDQTGGLGGADIAGALPLLSAFLQDDTIRYTVWVGEDGNVHHLELYVNIILDATLIDPEIGEATLNIDFKTDLDQLGETFTIEAPTDYETMEFEATDLLGNLTSGGGSETDVEDYIIEFEGSFGESVTGTLSGENDWDVYSFEASEGDVITVTLKAATLESSFDAQLILLNEAGEELAFNDDHDSDREDLGVFDAVINQFTIPTDGQYRVVATWLTETRDGDYELLLEKVE